MEQKIEAFTAEDTARIEKQRTWVRDHYEEDARENYESLKGKFQVLDTILKSDWIEPSETWKLQSLGITFGDILAEMTGLEWVMVEDAHGRDPALQDPGTTILVFPLTAISKRIEQGEVVDLGELLKEFVGNINRLRGEADMASDLPGNA